MAVPPSPATCPECGASLPPGRLRGLCAACLWTSIEAEPVAAGSGEAVPLMLVAGIAVESELARGGMGIVYRARESDPARNVALKMLLPQFSDSTEMRSRFRQEAAAVAALDHPAILPVYRVGEHGGMPYFTMKLATGGTLAERQSQYAGRWRAIAELVATLATAVQFAHERGVLHRDLKPGNVLFDEGGRPFLSDFGLVKLAGVETSFTRSISVLGTPHYLSPEVAARDARQATTASDVWSLGVILYELLGGRLPFMAEGIPSLLRQIVEEFPPPLTGVPPDLKTICLKCLAKEPAGRYATAAALAEDLRAWLEGRPIAAHPVSHIERAWRWARRNPALAAVSVAFLLALLGGGIALWRSNQRLEGALHESWLAQARTVHASGRSEGRAAALAALARNARGPLAAEARDEAVSLLALPAWRELRRLPTFHGVMPSFDDEFQRMATLESDGQIHVRKLTGAGETAALPATETATDRLGRFSGDGKNLAVHFTGGGWRIWNFERNEWRSDLSGLAGEPVFSPDGRFAASGRDDGAVTIHDLTGGGPPRNIATDLKPARPRGFSVDGRFVVVTGPPGTTRALALEAASGRVAFTFQHAASAALLDVSCTAPDGVLFASTNYQLYHWRLDFPERWPRPLAGHVSDVWGAALHPSGAWGVSTSLDGTTRLWELAGGRPVATLPIAGRAVRFSRDGRQLAVEEESGQFAVLCEFEAPAVCRQFLLPHVDPNTATAKGSWCTEFSPDGRWMASGERNGLWLYETAAGTPAGFQAVGNCPSLSFDPLGRFLVAAGETGLHRWVLDFDTDGRLSRGRDIFRPMGQRTRLSLSAGGESMVASSPEGVEFFAGNDAGPRAMTSAVKGFNPVALSPDGKWAAASSERGPDVNVWETATGRLHTTLPTASRYTYVWFGRDGRAFYTCDARELKRWDTATWRPVWTVAARPGYRGRTFVTGSGDGRLLAAALGNQSTSLLDPNTGRILLNLAHPQPRPLSWLALDHKATRLAVTTDAHVVQVWDLQALGRELHGLGLDWEVRP